MIKCVIWDIDNTLLDGVYLEPGPAGRPPADPAMLGVLRELSGRGILHAIASRNPPEAANYAAAVTGATFAAAECGWGAKPDAIRAIIAELGIGADAVAFVDDEPIERAEVSAALPEVLVLSPEDAGEAVEWPEFSPVVVTAEASRRGQMYQQRRRRQAEARAFGGSRDDFLRRSGTRVVIEPASAADVPRLHELSVRTHQFNSAGQQVSTDALAELVGSASHRVVIISLSDQFGDDGIVGGCIIQTGTTTTRSWTVVLLMMSCRAMGRGVIDALLAWLCRAAAADGASLVRMPCRLTPRNVPLRVALAAAGFRAGTGDGAAGRTETGGGPPVEPGSTVFDRELTGPLPVLPGWAETRGGA